MKAKLYNFKHFIHCEFACINTTLVIIFSVICPLLGILFGLCSINGCDILILPTCALSPFWCIFFWIIEFAVFGASAAIIISTPDRRGMHDKGKAIIIFSCTLVLCYMWAPILFLASSFLLANLLVLVILLCLALLYTLFVRISRIASWCLFVFAAWMLYILYFTFALLLIN